MVNGYHHKCMCIDYQEINFDDLFRHKFADNLNIRIKIIRIKLPMFAAFALPNYKNTYILNKNVKIMKCGYEIKKYVLLNCDE